MYLFHAAIDQFIRSAKEQLLCQFVFRTGKLKIGLDLEPSNQIGFVVNKWSSLFCIHNLSGAFCQQVFVELDELFKEEGHELQWKEKARWIKFEEDVEEGTDRWGKPHVASLTFHSLVELRKHLEHGELICVYLKALFKVQV